MWQKLRAAIGNNQVDFSERKRIKQYIEIR